MTSTILTLTLAPFPCIPTLNHKLEASVLGLAYPDPDPGSPRNLRSFTGNLKPVDANPVDGPAPFPLLHAFPLLALRSIYAHVAEKASIPPCSLQAVRAGTYPVLALLSVLVRLGAL